MFAAILRTLLIVLLAGGLGIWIFGERGRLMQPSSWKGLRAAGLRSLLSLQAVHQYVYGRWTNQYIRVLLNYILPRMDERSRQWWADHYHSKVLTHEQAEAIVLLDHDLPQRDLEQIVPYPMARDLVLTGPPEVAAYECACRHARPNPCQPTQVCMVVGQPFVDFTLEHNPHSSRRLTQAEAVEMLQAEHQRGHVHSAWFKDACLDRFYVICNCCKCCCGGIEAMVKYGSPMFASSGYVAQVDAALCSACGTCVEACPFGALSLETELEVNWEKCMGCGVCESQCTTQSISLVRDERKGIPLDVRVMV
jgi:formate hydrogenlyase subunit 6/NADH:ubiquinone oxidoreductase subunit I